MNATLDLDSQTWMMLQRVLDEILVLPTALAEDRFHFLIHRYRDPIFRNVGAGCLPIDDTILEAYKVDFPVNFLELALR